MLWSWDSNEITFDQNCWTFDGYNGCVEAPPVEPPYIPDGGTSKKLLRDYFWYKNRYKDQDLDKDELEQKIIRHMRDDEIVDFIRAILMKGLL